MSESLCDARNQLQACATIHHSGKSDLHHVLFGVPLIRPVLLATSFAGEQRPSNPSRGTVLDAVDRSS
jgi:hypothetical protein